MVQDGVGVNTIRQATPPSVGNQQYIGRNSGAATSSSLILFSSLTPPGGGSVFPAVGDIMFALVGLDTAGATITPPAGWTQIDGGTQGVVSAYLFAHTATSADTSSTSYTFSSSAAPTDFFMGGINVYRSAAIEAGQTAHAVGTSGTAEGPTPAPANATDWEVAWFWGSSPTSPQFWSNPFLNRAGSRGGFQVWGWDDTNGNYAASLNWPDPWWSSLNTDCDWVAGSLILSSL